MRYVLMACVLLAGCAEMEAARQRAAAQQAADDNAQCQYYGIRYGTPEYGQCRIMLQQARAQADANQTAAAAALLGAAAIMAQPPQPAYVPATPTTTNCWRNGPYLRCNSF